MGRRPAGITRRSITTQTCTKVGEQRGILRAWAKKDEVYHPHVKRPKIRNNCSLQFYRAFTYNAKGPCHIYNKETQEEKHKAEVALKEENQRNKLLREALVPQARATLREIGDNAANSRARP
ncbi:hypothetical protein E8E12_003102 [Didymella heteroderae]|uniref:Uncharacterized protein n=1 Tax=Didymella heteroderae TaxID=1769908 RepID=A0A9P4WK44_9PLEO|nr:hypothetical protein E8E12_003102 [Didymella heteroderae]